MVGKRKPHRLTEGELQLMSMLWEAGPLTLSQAHEAFHKYGPSVAYPTMQTRLNRLADKGLVTRSSARPAVYQTAISAEEVGSSHIERLAGQVSPHSVAPLVAHLISEGPLEPGEIRELRRLLAEAEKRSRKKQQKTRGKN